jgi:hypothetical protein
VPFRWTNVNYWLHYIIFRLQGLTNVLSEKSNSDIFIPKAHNTTVYTSGKAK